MVFLCFPIHFTGRTLVTQAPAVLGEILKAHDLHGAKEDVVKGTSKKGPVRCLGKLKDSYD